VPLTTVGIDQTDGSGFPYFEQGLSAPVRFMCDQGGMRRLDVLERNKLSHFLDSFVVDLILE
jgi:hypothetical protein